MKIDEDVANKTVTGKRYKDFSNIDEMLGVKKFWGIPIPDDFPDVFIFIQIMNVKIRN